MRSMLISAIAAGSLLISTTAAAAQQVPAAARTGSDIEDSDQLAGGLMLIGLIAVIAVIGIFVLLDDDDEPESP